MHRLTEECGLIEGANGSIAKDTEPLRSSTKGAATSSLTHTAFSWKFALTESQTFARPLFSA
jgi:hypothetical protein